MRCVFCGYVDIYMCACACGTDTYIKHKYTHAQTKTQVEMRKRNAERHQQAYRCVISYLHADFLLIDVWGCGSMCH